MSFAQSSPVQALVLLTIATIFLASRPTGAVKCYKCDTGDTFCNDPFNPSVTGVKTCEAVYCLKSKASAQGVSAVGRDCAEAVEYDGCKTFDILGIPTTACTCKTEYCNGSVGMKSSLMVTIGIFSIAFVTSRL